MAATTSAIGAAIDYLAAAATAAFSPPIQVVDGPLTQASQDFPISRVWIGFDPSNPDQAAAEGDQEFATITQGRTRDERFTIVCAVEYWSGDITAKTVRAGAFSLLRTFELLLRGVPPTGPGDVTLGGAVLYSQVAGGIAYDQIPDSNGLIGRIVFHVSCRARLTS